MSRDEGPGEPTPDSAGDLAEALARAAADLADRQPARAEARLLEILERHPEAAVAWDALGRARNNLRRLPEAEAAFREALRHDRRLAPAWNHLGHVLRATGRTDEAHDAFARAVELDPTAASACRNLAGSLLARGERERAVPLLETALRAAPDDALAHLQLAHARQAAEETDAAAAHYRAALEHRPDLADAAAGLGAVHQSTGDYAAAGRRYREALAIEPDHAMAVAGLAAILEIEGRHAEGYAVLEPRLAAAPPPPGLAVTGARLLRRLGRGADGLTLLERTTAAASPSDAALLDYTRGDLWEDSGDYHRAFQHYRRANERLGTGFDPRGFCATVDGLIEFFSPARLAALPRATDTTGVPVFIVGMPRSGTSLVEQALGAHSRAWAGGERTDLFNFVRELAGGDPGANWPGALNAVTPDRLDELAGRYLDRIPGGGPDAPVRATDKMPANFLNLGLAALLLPGARIVWCRRDPLDTGLSCYRQNFLSEGMDFARRLEHIALYQLGCQRLMAHWRQVLGLPVHAVDYEALVGDFDAGVGALLDFLELSVEPACLRPDLSRRVVATASYDQVRRPVYASSVGRWRRYERELAPLTAALAAGWPR
jgi:tetratricopeptide (TPR) repeat protein